jgi:hypothetical protein
MKKAVSMTLVLALSGASTAQASWFSDFTGINIDVPAGKFEIGTPQPGPAIQRLPGVIQRLPQDMANLANPAGLALAFAIRQAKAQASWSAGPIPAPVRQQLGNMFPTNILQGVRYTTFDRGRITLDSAVMLLNNDVSAVTLEDVIVFRSEQEAMNVSTWAHELTHVMQYASRGVDTFANTYTTNAWVLENEAKDVQARFRPAPVPNYAGFVTPQAQACFVVTGQFLCGDSNYLLYPANPNTAQITGPANGRIFAQNGAWIAVDMSGRQFIAQRVR